MRVAKYTAAVIGMGLAFSIHPGPRVVGHEVTSPEVPRWSHLHFKAKRLFVSATTDIRLSAGYATPLEESPEGRALDPNARTLSLQVASEALGRRSTENVVFDGREGITFLREKQKLGSKGYFKWLRFTHDGVFLRRSEPSDSAEAAATVKQWSRRSETWYAAPTACNNAIDPTALLHLVSARVQAPGGWKKGDRETYCVFSKKAFSQVTLTSDGEVGRQASFVVDGETLDGEIDVVRLRVTGSPLGGSNEPMELLGLEGDVEIYVDARYGLPVEVCGDLSPVGRVSIKLARASRF